MKISIAILAAYLAALGIISPPQGAVCTGKPPTAAAAEEKKPDTGLELVSQGDFTITAYSSTVGETDATPCIAADGSDICRRWMLGETLCASNDYPFGTVLWIGGETMTTCTVADRMNRRYTGKKYIDLYFGTDTPEARKFGVRRAQPVSIEPSNNQPHEPEQSTADRTIDAGP